MRAICWRLKRRDNGILRATNLDRDIPVTAAGFEGLYRSIAGVTPAAVTSSDDLAVDNSEVSGAIAVTTGVSASDIEAGLYDEARVTIFEVDTADPSEAAVLHYGILGQVERTSDRTVRAESRSLTQLLQQQIGETNMLTCRATLGSGEEAPAIKRCGVGLASFEVSASVTDQDANNPRRAFTATTLTQDAGWFTYGICTFTSGDNEGFSREVKVHRAGGEIVFYEPLPSPIQQGDGFDITPGCDKTLESCRDKFGNLPNFRGEPYLLGQRFLLQVGSR